MLIMKQYYNLQTGFVFFKDKILVTTLTNTKQLLLVFMLCSTFLNAQTQTALAGTGATMGGPSGNWSNPGRITANDNSYTSVTSTSDLLEGTDFGFTIPAGSIINGIELEIERYASNNSGTRNGRDNVVRLVKNGTPIGTNNAIIGTYNTSEAIITYGSSTD